MKKILFLAAAFLLCGVASAQRNSVERLFREGMETRGVHWGDLKTNGLPIELSGEKIRIDGAELFFFDDDTPESTRERFIRIIRDLDDPFYETWIDISNDGMQIRILAKKGRGKNKEIVALVTGDKSGVIRFRGELSRDLLQKFAHKI
jgi:hypothetical protein